MQPTTINVVLLIQAKQVVAAARLANTAPVHEATIMVADIADLVSPDEFTNFRRAFRREMLKEHSPAIELLSLVQTKDLNPQTVGRTHRGLTSTEVAIVLQDPSGY